MKAIQFFLSLIFISIPLFTLAQDSLNDNTATVKDDLKNSDKLVILWTSADKEVADKMVFMYTYNSKRFKWWEDITLVVWGPSAKLLAEDNDLQKYLKKIMEQGTVVKACKGCADQYGVSEKLEELGITVKYMSEFTDYIKEGRHILTL